MKFVILFICSIVFVSVMGIVFICCSYSSASVREKKIIASTMAAYHYDTISGHLSIYRTFEEATNNKYMRDTSLTVAINNYTFVISLSDSLITFDSLKRQSNDIALNVFNEVMLKDTATYHYLILQMNETLRDTVLTFPYRTKDLQAYTEKIAAKQ